MAAAGHAPGLIDTDILIDAERGVPDAVAFTHAQQALTGTQISAVTAMELIVGCRNRRELQVLESFLSLTVVHEITPMVSQDARDLVKTLCLSHGLMIPDALIAATALSLGLPLYTKNVRHFQMIPSLVVVRPY
jgi:predicted nucleic acid-binding protein